MAYRRTRDIEDSLGTCLRIGIASHPQGAVTSLRRMDLPDQPIVMLSVYGAELLTAFIMAARLSVPGVMPDEVAEGLFPVHFHLSYGAEPAIIVEQYGEGDAICIGSTLWDRLYAELCLVTAHGREMTRRADMAVH